jgi:hypothetical protein
VLFLLVANLEGRDVEVVVVTATGLVLPLVLAPLGTYINHYCSAYSLYFSRYFKTRASCVKFMRV